MKLSRVAPWWGLTLATVLATGLAAGCRDSARPTPEDAGAAADAAPDATVDAGDPVTSCDDDQDCAAAGQVCHTTRGYCVECDGRHAGECPADQTCRFDFTCVPLTTSSTTTDGGVPDGGSGCSGACTVDDRSACGADQVCRGGACCPPPARCGFDDDCPAARPFCNSVNGACFGGDSCVNDDDCLTKPGCGGGGCFCDQAKAECALRPNECDDDPGCPPNKVCTLDSTPRRCIDAPVCAADADCAQNGLVCDQGLGLCKNGPTCATTAECAASDRLCEDGACVAKTCLNTPSLCTASQVCDPTTLRCEARPDTPCAVDTECPVGQYCDTGAGICAPGCRTDGDCPGGGVCNATHQCQYPMGGLCGPCTTDADCPAGTRCKDSLTSGKLCYEPCSLLRNELCVINPMAQCILVNCSCLLPGF